MKRIQAKKFFFDHVNPELIELYSSKTELRKFETALVNLEKAEFELVLKRTQNVWVWPITTID